MTVTTITHTQHAVHHDELIRECVSALWTDGYQVDRIGPLKDFSFYHTGCFKCYACNSKLTLKTYCNNQNDQDDKEVYCSSHVPKPGPGHLDGEAVGIRSALNVPRSAQFVNDQIRPGGRPSLDGDALVLRSPYSR
ncbi:hypothetical protein Pmani_035162, partial [Petrolisthes manimaculis]